MRKLLLIIIALAVTAVVACKKAKAPTGAPSVQPNNKLDSLVFMSASVNGIAWSTDTPAFASFVKNSSNDSSDIGLSITAVQQTPLSTITFNISHYTGTDTYYINPPINTATYYEGNTRHFATSGYIFITTDTMYALIGNFSFTSGSYSITDGAFNVAAP